MRPSAFKRLVPTEHQEQCAVIDWWNMACHRWRLPAFALFAIPNAGAGAQRGQAGKMKGEGVRRGVPDLLLAVPVGRAAGLFVEMKRKGGQVSPEQRHVGGYLIRAGYLFRVCYSFEEARREITAYLRDFPLPEWAQGSADHPR